MSKKLVLVADGPIMDQFDLTRAIEAALNGDSDEPLPRGWVRFRVVCKPVSQADFEAWSAEETRRGR